MKKIILSAAVAAMAFSGTAMAADKGIDIVTTGQAVLYYETGDRSVTADKGMFDKDNSAASAGVQLNLDADLKNNFTFGSQITYLGASGLEKNLVSSEKQSTGGALTPGTTNELALTKMFIAKKIGNTTVKLGRQELPKSLSPLAFSEGWNVFKNTFDAAVVVNSDIPTVTLVGAYVSSGTGHTLGTTADNLTAVNGAYMLTAQTSAIPMTTLTGSYYTLHNVAAAGNDAVTAYWIDAKIAPTDAPLGIKLGLQTGEIDPDVAGVKSTTGYGAILSADVDAISASIAYTSVNEGAVALRNVGTSVKTALFTQMIYNQNAIVQDADTVVANVSYNMGDMGTLGLAYGSTSAGNTNNLMGANNDYKELDVTYKLNAGGVSYFAAYVTRDLDRKGTVLTGSPINVSTAQNSDSEDIIRLWARYNF
jgi:hypothetical protein